MKTTDKISVYNREVVVFYLGSCPRTTFRNTATHAACLPRVTSGDVTRRSSAANDLIATMKWPRCRRQTTSHTMSLFINPLTSGHSWRSGLSVRVSGCQKLKMTA